MGYFERALRNMSVEARKRIADGARETGGANMRRSVEMPTATIRAKDDSPDGRVRFSGWLLKWDAPTQETILDWDAMVFCYESFAPGSMARTFEQQGCRDIKLYRQHTNAVATAGKFTLLEERDEGPYFEGETIPTSTGRDLATELREGVMDRMSVGFMPLKSEYQKDGKVLSGSELLDAKWDDEKIDLVRRLEVRLYEASVVSHPAYEEATVEEIRANLPVLFEAVQTDLARGALTVEQARMYSSLRDLIEETVTPAALDANGNATSDAPAADEERFLLELEMEMDQT